MTPEIHEELIDLLRESQPLRDFESLIERAIDIEREACALVCDAIGTDKHAQYKGRSPHAPNNDHRADTYTEGESDGAELCADAIRARGKAD